MGVPAQIKLQRGVDELRLCRFLCGRSVPFRSFYIWQARRAFPAQPRATPRVWSIFPKELSPEGAHFQGFFEM
jgi:hypothetical protein